MTRPASELVGLSLASRSDSLRPVQLDPAGL